MEDESPLGRTTSICKNRDVLRPDYQPEELVERDDEISEYANIVNPILNGWAPDNAFLYGKAGTGKTATTKYILDWLHRDIEEHNIDVELNVVDINCDGHDSSYRVAVEIVNELRGPNNQIAESGHPRSKVYDWMWEEFNKLGGTIIVILDEIDHIGQDDSILYQLSRGESMGELEDGKLSIIGISNDFSFRNNLSAKVRDSLCEKEIHFSAYDAQELQSILMQRCEMALYDEAYDKAVVRLVAAIAAKDKGSARQAIDILRNAVDIAISDEANQITEDHVHRAREKVGRGRVKDIIDTLSPHGEHVLKAVTELEARDETPAKSKEIYRIYKDVCHNVGADTLTLRSVRDHLSELDMLSVLASEMKNEGLRSGSYKIHELDAPVDDAVAYFNEKSEYEDIDISTTQKTL